MTKTTTKKTKATKASSELRRPQIRILQALVKHGELSRAELAAKAPVDQAACCEFIGSEDKATRLKNDKKHFPSLISLGFVSSALPKDGGAARYTITAKGREAAKA
jgi:hypothetical protein